MFDRELLVFYVDIIATRVVLRILGLVCLGQRDPIHRTLGKWEDVNDHWLDEVWDDSLRAGDDFAYFSLEYAYS